MLEPSLSPNEDERLGALRSLQILDTPFEDRFDRVTRLATRLFDVPISLVSLIDANRQWFKSCEGLSVMETSRAISMCGHAILKDDMLVITDATQDSRFADNPLVIHGPNIRFYAGQPLGGLGGYKMGTLCIIDHRPRTFKKEDRDSLKDLACIVENELSNVQLNQANKRLWEEESLLKYKNEDLQKLNEALQWEIKNRKEAEQDRHRFLKFLWI